MVVAPSAGETETTNPIQKMMGMTMAGQMIFFAFFTGAYSMMSILREDEEGTLARLFTTPTDRTSILTGKFVAVFITVILQGLVLMVAGHYAFGINWGEPAGIALALTGQVVAATGLGRAADRIRQVYTARRSCFGWWFDRIGNAGRLVHREYSKRHACSNGHDRQLYAARLGAQNLADGYGWSNPRRLASPVYGDGGMGIVMFVIGAVMFRRRFA